MPRRRTTRRRTTRRRTRKGGGWFSCGKYFCGVDDIFEAKGLVTEARGKELNRLEDPDIHQVTKIVRDVCYAKGGNSKYGKCNGKKINEVSTVRIHDVAKQILEDLHRPYPKTPTTRGTVTASRPSPSNALTPRRVTNMGSTGMHVGENYLNLSGKMPPRYEGT